MRKRQRRPPRLKQPHVLQPKLKQPGSRLRPRHRLQRKKLLKRPPQLLKQRQNRQQLVVEVVIRKIRGRRIKRENE